MAQAGAGAAAVPAIPPEGARVNLTNHTVTGTDNTGFPWTFSATFIVRSSGKLDLNTTGTGSPPTDPTNEWITAWPDATEADLYECFVTEISTMGSASRTGTMDTWIDCGGSDGTKTWSLSSTTQGDKNWVIDLSIRSKISMTVHDTGRITLEVRDEFS